MTAKDATQAFRIAFGDDPEGVWAGPGRVNLIGEHTDYNDGLVLPMALPQRTYAAARKRDDSQVRFVSEGQEAGHPMALADIAPGNPTGWERYPAGVLWALMQRGYSVAGMDIAFWSDVPIGSGLSSSAAIESATAAACSDLNGLGLLADDAGRLTLSELCVQAENVIAGAPTGGMDQAIALRANQGCALFLDCRDGSVQQIPFDLEKSGLALLVINTRVRHELSDGQYGKRRRECEKACAKLGVESLRDVDPANLTAAMEKLGWKKKLVKRTRHVVTEIQRVRQAVAAIEAKDFVELGHLFVDSHASLRDDYEVSCPQLDVAVVSALEAGALGARMTGGGFGGSAIALVYAEAAQKTQQAIGTAFTAHDMAVPEFLVATPGAPASKC